HAALWRAWIDVAKVRKIQRVGELAERGEPVRLDHLGGIGLRGDAPMQRSACGGASANKQTATR
ncbi:MAG TPA: hypothetical protein VIH63_02285, partial [Xanthobacteraceae bacterium]